MKRIYPIAMFCLIGAAGAQAPADDLLAGSNPISGEELKARLTGKSFTWQAASARFTARVQYQANGYAFINVSSGQNDSGTWTVEDGKVCTQWRQLPSSCSPEQARAKGDLLLIKRADGTWATMTPN